MRVRVRPSTAWLAVAFSATLVLYLLVRPEPAAHGAPLSVIPVTSTTGGPASTRSVPTHPPRTSAPSTRAPTTATTSTTTTSTTTIGGG